MSKVKIRYRRLPHTADAKIRAYGDDLAELFENSLTAVIQLWIGHQKGHSREKRTETFTANNQERLLYEFLEHFIIVFDSERIIPVEINQLTINTDNEWLRLQTEIGYAPIQNYRIETEIKAMTYGMMRFGALSQRIFAQFLLDL